MCYIFALEIQHESWVYWDINNTHKVGTIS